MDRADGRTAYRMSMSLRGWITETDELMTLGADKRPSAIAIRGYTDSGDATEDFSVDDKGVAIWKTAVDGGTAPFAGKRYNIYGGPWLASEKDVEVLVAAGSKGIDMLPSGHASIAFAAPTTVQGPGGARTIRLAYVTGLGFSPSPVWLDADNRFFGSRGIGS